MQTGRAPLRGHQAKGTRTPMHRSALLNVMVKAAFRAGRSLKRDLGEVENLQVSVKGPRNFVTAADHRAEAILHEELAKARPDYGFLGEEGGAHVGADRTHRWIVDPLDGTTNFLHGIPHFAVSIALERNGAIVAALTYNPANDELFVAEHGKGAFLDLAAGMLLVREAGGFASDPDGGDAVLATGHIVAGNETMHRELLDLLKKAGKEAAQEAQTS
jgi:fructose-1,6-bisphosphatase/inositol monophosphatase family enzyme